MKRGTPSHPKTLWLQTGLGVRLREVVGILEMLWHFTAAFAPQGDVGKWRDDQIAKACDWPIEDAATLIRCLEEAGFLDPDPDPKRRYLVHDWPKHADQGVKKYLKRNGLSFFYPSSPGSSKRRPSSGRVTDKGRTCTSGVRTAVAVAPAPAVAPATSTAPASTNGEVGRERAREEAPPSPPPAPTAQEAHFLAPPVVATPPSPPPEPPRPVYRKGDTLPDGRVVSEVDEQGRPLVVLPADTPERRELRKARQEFAAELARCSEATGIPPDRLQAKYTRPPHSGSAISNPESIESLSWLRVSTERLRSARLEAECSRQEQAQHHTRPATAAERTIATVRAAMAEAGRGKA